MFLVLVVYSSLRQVDSASPDRGISATHYASRLVDAHIHPRPTSDERAAILEALARSGGDPEPPSFWWRAGVEENVDADVERRRTAL